MSKKTNKELKKTIKEVAKKEEEPKFRQILIETNGSDIRIVKSEVAGMLELKAILMSLLNYVEHPPMK